jgi:H+/Cl- antiporter ClcA
LKVFESVKKIVVFRRLAELGDSKQQEIYRQQTTEHAAVWIAAILVGLTAVLYARIIHVMQSFFFRFTEHNAIWMIVLTPILFVAATGLVRKFAPEAKGSGIPQVLEAMTLVKGVSVQKAGTLRLTSLRTAGVKVVSSAVGILGGASIGREGPMIQIASSVFAFVGRIAGRWAPKISPRSFLVAGASAGVAAAFNTPIAGISFAIEELADGVFAPFKQTIMLSVIVAGVTAQALLGDYLFFGHFTFSESDGYLLLQTVLLGVLGGVAGSLLARLLAYPRLTRLPERWWRRAAVCGFACALIGYGTHGATAGSGYEATQTQLSYLSASEADVMFPVWKLITTVLSYLSGMAGGLFSPSLSIGAGLGVSVAKIFHFANFKVCALLGMTAFFSGVVQAPLTAVIIVMEMTDERILILPLMAAAFISHGIARRMMPTPLYRLLAQGRISDLAESTTPGDGTKPSELYEK